MMDMLKYYLGQFLKFNKRDRLGIIVLVALIIISVGINIFIKTIDFGRKSDFSEIKKYLNSLSSKSKSENSKELNLFPFDPNNVTEEELDSMHFPRNIKNNLLKFRKAGGKFFSNNDFRKIYGISDSLYSVIEPFLVLKDNRLTVKTDAKPKIQLHQFDPNKCDYNQLLELGFNSFQAHNTIEYLKKKGKFTKKEDILKIYGIDKELFDKISPFIEIQPDSSEVKKVEIPDIERIEINKCTVEDLLKIRKVGVKLAERIITYRNLLGGFYQISQLKEVYGMDNEAFTDLSKSISIDTTTIHKIRVNFFNQNNLPRHPYLKPGQFVSILNFRDKNGPVKNLEQLIKNNNEDSVGLKKMRPYFNFN